MSRQLIGRLAFVTGGGSGIGRSTCRILAEQGAKVIIGDCNIEGAETTKQSIPRDHRENVSIMQLDVSCFDSVVKAVSNTIKQYQSVPNIIVNSAGIIRDNYLLKMTENDYDIVYRVNLKGTFLVTQQFAKAMIDNNIKGGSIINISSIVAKLSTIAQANYAASKSGVVSLTEVAAKELGKYGIRVNAVLPGYIDTHMVKSLPDNIKQQIIAKCPMERVGHPDEIGEVIAFLASERASYINGASIEVTGGLK